MIPEFVWILEQPPLAVPLALVAIGLPLSIALFVDGYHKGPGWLAHVECPHCCWCSGRLPLGDRIERRVRERLDRLVDRGGDEDA